jgi:hypothetical protein
MILSAIIVAIPLWIVAFALRDLYKQIQKIDLENDNRS